MNENQFVCIKYSSSLAVRVVKKIPYEDRTKQKICTTGFAVTTYPTEHTVYHLTDFNVKP